MLGESNGIRPHNHLDCKRTLNHLVRLDKWLGCFVSPDLYGAFECMLLSSHVRVSELIYFRYRACFEQGVTWHSGNYRVQIHFEKRTLHDINIQLNVTFAVYYVNDLPCLLSFQEINWESC